MQCHQIRIPAAEAVQSQQPAAAGHPGLKKPVVNILISGADLRNVLRLKGELEVLLAGEPFVGASPSAMSHLLGTAEGTRVISQICKETHAFLLPDKSRNTLYMCVILPS